MFDYLENVSSKFRTNINKIFWTFRKNILSNSLSKLLKLLKALRKYIINSNLRI